VGVTPAVPLPACAGGADPATLLGGRYGLSSEYATTIRERRARHEGRRRRGAPRVLAIQLLGPLTILAGIVWAVAQPYRIVFLEPRGKGLYEVLAQGPLLVVAVGLVYALVVAPGLIADLEDEAGDSSR
jgi:hypothetical protein